MALKWKKSHGNRGTGQDHAVESLPSDVEMGEGSLLPSGHKGSDQKKDAAVMMASAKP